MAMLAASLPNWIPAFAGMTGLRVARPRSDFDADLVPSPENPRNANFPAKALKIPEPLPKIGTRRQTGVSPERPMRRYLHDFAGFF
jgi:hypothetical protein